MKTIVTIFLATIITVSLCACGASDKNAPSESSNVPDFPDIIEEIDPETADTDKIKESFDLASAYVQSVIDLSAAEVQTDDEDPTNLQGYWLLDEQSGDMTLAPELEVDGNTIVIGETTVKDLDSLGVDVTKYADTVEPGENVAVGLEKGGKSFSLQVNNDSDESFPLDEMTISGFNAGTAEYMLPYSYMGITGESSFEDVASLLGNSVQSVQVLADYVSTSIGLSYYGEISQEGNRITANSLEVVFDYDPAAGSTKITSVNMLRYVYEIEN